MVRRKTKHCKFCGLLVEWWSPLSYMEICLSCYTIDRYGDMAQVRRGREWLRLNSEVSE